MSITTVSDVASWMGQFAPLHLAESWDNVGLLWGDPTAPVDRVMTCLTVTPASAHEAIDAGAQLIVTHHPVLFRPLQKITADGPEGKMLWSLARAGIAIYSPHTAFDNATHGINQGLADRLGLLDVKALRAPAERPQFKVVTFTPAGDRSAVLEAAFAEGAGQIEDYSECSFTTGGRGTFHGGETTHPVVGQAGRRELVREWKIEMVCPGDRLNNVLAAIRANHSYEVAAIDVIPLKSLATGPGVGRIGRLPEPTTLEAFSRTVARCLGTTSLQFVGEPSHKVEHVAIVCGAGDDFLKDAHKARADVLLTGEARFHRGLEAQSLKIGLIVAGHHATERPGVEDLAARLGQAFPTAKVWASRHDADPFAAMSI